MDTLSHGLWALVIFWGTNYRWWAFLVGMLPDLLSFGIYLPYRIISQGFHFGPPAANAIPWWVYASYSVTHSFLTWIGVGVILYLLGKKWWPIVFAAMAHIALDIPTHVDFFPTPFLWPLSNYQFHGISWGTPWVFGLNWLCLAIVFTLIFFYERQRRRDQMGTSSAHGSQAGLRSKTSSSFLKSTQAIASHRPSSPVRRRKV